MTNNVSRLNVALREGVGKKHARRLRRDQDQVPGIVYGAGKGPQSIQISNKELTNALANESTYSRILTLHVANQGEQQVVLKQVQRHPSRPRLLHIDFLRIDPNAKLTMEIPVHLLGADQTQGIKDGGILSHHLTEVEIQCLPADLPEYIELSIAHLSLGDSLHLSDLKLPKGVELTVNVADEEHNQAVVSIVKPHVPTAAELASEAAAPEAPVMVEEPEEKAAETEE
jgi:large subunit ribosomal protein L25